MLIMQKLEKAGRVTVIASILCYSGFSTGPLSGSVLFEDDGLLSKLSGIILSKPFCTLVGNYVSVFSR